MNGRPSMAQQRYTGPSTSSPTAGGPEGGYVYFYREREPGWYSWRRDWGTEPTYTKIDGKLIQTFEDYAEKVAVAPLDWEPNDEENEDITILDEYIMEAQDTA